MKPLKSQNYYEILGVSRDSTPEEIRKAYEIAKHTFQSNSLATYSLFSDQENQEILSFISRAYETLYNRQTRTEYDNLLESLGGDLSPLTNRTPPARESVRTQEAPNPPPMVQLGQASGSSRPTSASGQGALPINLESSAPSAATASKKSAASPPAESAKPKPQTPVNEKAVEDFLRGVDLIDGKALRKVRQIRGISVDDIAQQTKIRKAYIQYLEEEQFEFLPAAIYVRGFITMIASILRLPQQRVAEDYMRIYKTKTL